MDAFACSYILECHRLDTYYTTSEVVCFLMWEIQLRLDNYKVALFFLSRISLADEREDCVC